MEVALYASETPPVGAEFPDGVLVHVFGSFAALAEPPGEPLGYDAVHSRGREKGLHPHVGKACDGGRGVVGVEGGQDEVPRQRRFHAGLGRLTISYLPDHYHVRIRAQDAPKTCVKVSPILGLTWTWLIPRILYSTGSSTVTMFFSVALSSPRVASSVVDLPEPIGPVTSIVP